MQAKLLASLVVLTLATSTLHPLYAKKMKEAIPQKSATLIKIDLNQADSKALSKAFKGIGPKRAEAIIKYRKAHGSFKSLEDLALVKGLGNQFVKKHLVKLQEAFAIN